MRRTIRTGGGIAPAAQRFDLFFLFIPALLAASLIVSCSPSPSSLRLDLDEGFGLLFPSLARELGRDIQPLGDRDASGHVVIASPLRALDHVGDVRPDADAHLAFSLVVPFAPPSLFGNPAVHPVLYDTEKAYAFAGRKAGARSKRLAETGKPDSGCSIVFQESLIRDRKAAQAFLLAFERASGGKSARMVEFNPDQDAVDVSGAAKAAIAEAASEGTGIVFLAMDAQDQARAAAAEDARRLYFADTLLWDPSPADRRVFSLTIEGKERALAAEAKRVARILASGRKPLTKPIAPKIVQRAGNRR
ncbi:MAG TPA: hypothetical protein VIO60_03965 [Rectinemataceae bacterium]